jgi:hypothetical protein
MHPTQLNVRRSLFENLGAIAPKLFTSRDQCTLFLKRVLPTVNIWRERLSEAYNWENGRPETEPAVLFGVLMLQFLERVPDRWSWLMRSEIRYAPSARRLRAEFFLQLGREDTSSETGV